MKALQGFYRLAYSKEASDCSVRALAVACAAPYKVAYSAMLFAGRGPEQAATVEMMAQAAVMLGYVLVPVQVRSKTLRKLCSELSGEPGGLLAFTSSHVVGFWNGEGIDFARDTLMRVKLVCSVKRIKK
jgi:hypothetical protein